MPTIIDSLIVTLGLDSKGVESKAPGVLERLRGIEKSAGQAEKSTRGFGKSLNDVGHSLGGFLALVGGSLAMRAFIRDTVDANTQLALLSQNLGLSVQSLFAMGAAGRVIGVGSQAIQGLAASLRAIPGQLEAGQQPALLNVLARAGIDWEGQKPEQMMVELSQWFATMPRNVSFGLGTSLGLSSQQMSFLLQGPQRVRREMNVNRGFAPTGAENQQFFRLRMQMAELELQFEKIGMDVLSRVTPAIEAFLGILMRIGAWAQHHERIVTFFALLVTTFSALAAIASTVALAVGAISAFIAAVSTAGPVLLVVAAVTALGSAIALLWNDYRVWADGGRSLFDWKAFGSAIHSTAVFFEDLAHSIEYASEAFSHWVSLHDTPSKMVHAVKSAAMALGADVSRSAEAFGIATAEGFFHHGKPNIPQRAHNPGDIEYGEFARKHGATGFLTAEGGVRIAQFGSTAEGWEALYSLLGTKHYASLHGNALLAAYTGSTGALPAGYARSFAAGVRNASGVLHGVPGASHGAMLASMSHSGNSTDNSVTNNIGTINLQSSTDTRTITPGVARGMDWSTILGQANAGLF